MVEKRLILKSSTGHDTDLIIHHGIVVLSIVKYLLMYI